MMECFSSVEFLALHMRCGLQKSSFKIFGIVRPKGGMVGSASSQNQKFLPLQVR